MSSKFEEIHAATSLMIMKAKGGQQRYQSSNHIQLPPLVLAPATTQPRFECYSSSSLNSCSSSDHCPSAYTPPSSSMRYSYNTPSPSPMDAPMPEASGHCFGNYDSRRYSQSPGGSSFPSTYRSYPSSYRDQNPFPPPPLRQHESPTLRLSSMAPYPSSAPPLNTSPSFAASQEYATARYDMAISQGAFGYNASCYIKQESPSPSQREDSLGPGDVTFTSEDVIEADRTVLPLPPSPIRKVRSSLHSPNQVRASSPRKTKIKLTRKNKAYLRQQKLNEWHQYLDEFLRSDQASLLSSRAGTILTTLAANGQAMVTTSTVKNFKSTTSTSSRNRNNIHGAISTHRFVLPINVEAKDWHSLAQSTTGTIATTDEEIANHGCYYISCVRWERELWITNSDICHIVKFRMEVLGFQVIDREKLFEGVYSDLRVVSKQDYRYEEAKGSFLNALDELGCISMHKRQKLYKWNAIPHQQLFTSAIRRSILSGKSCKPIRQPALSLCSGDECIESVLGG